MTRTEVASAAGLLAKETSLMFLSPKALASLSRVKLEDDHMSVKFDERGDPILRTKTSREEKPHPEAKVERMQSLISLMLPYGEKRSVNIIWSQFQFQLFKVSKLNVRK